MKQKSIFTIIALLFVVITVFGVSFGFGNRPTAIAASLESDNDTAFAAADSSPYRHEVSASNYISGQVWSAKSASTANVSDASGIRWAAVAAEFNASNNISDVSGIRWAAIADTYASNASGLRWIAIADYFASK
jgi:hypothetical protein